MSLIASIAVRSGIYLTFAGIGTAAVMDFEGFEPKHAGLEPVHMAMAVVWAKDHYGAGDASKAPGVSKLAPSAFALSAENGVAIDMAKFSPGGEHWSKMNSDDPAVRQLALDELYAAYGKDFMMRPIQNDVHGADSNGSVPIPPVKPSVPRA